MTTGTMVTMVTMEMSLMETIPIVTIGAIQVIQPTLITPPPIMDMDPITMMMDAISQQILMAMPTTGNTVPIIHGTHPWEWVMEQTELTATAGQVSQLIPIPPQQITDMDLNMTMTVVI